MKCAQINKACLTITEVACLLNVSYGTIHKAIRDGKLRALRTVKPFLIQVDDVDDYLKLKFNTQRYY